jgi:hypothetical protein
MEGFALLKMGGLYLHSNFVCGIFFLGAFIFAPGGVPILRGWGSAVGKKG